MKIEYSVIIRTMGTAGEKYDRLLSSIEMLEPKPAEVIIVLPEGFPLPKQRRGFESFYYCSQGMVRQRLFGLEKCSTQYALVCDDDIAFDTDFVRKLYRPIEMGMCSISVGPLLEFFVAKGIPAFCSAITASSMQTIFNKDYYVKMLCSGGWSFNRKIDTKKTNYYLTESAAWTCFFADVKEIKRIGMDDEIWLEKNKYAALDDQVMFYKAHCRGIKTIVVSDAAYQHLDAKTTAKRETFSGDKRIFAHNFNTVVFWHRFIFTQRKSVYKMGSLFAFLYRMVSSMMLSFLRVLLHRQSIKELCAQLRGIHNGVTYICSDEYKSLRSVIFNDNDIYTDL